MPSTPTRFPAGVTNVAKPSLLGNFILPNPLSAHVYSDDFDIAPVAANWTADGTLGTLTVGNGGLLIQTSTGAGTNSQAMTKNPGAFALTQGQQTWFMWNGQLSALTNILRIGMAFGGTFATNPTDGVYFQKQAAASPNIDFVMRVGGVSTTLAAVTTLTAATRITLGWYFDGKITPTIYAFSSALVPALVPQGQPYWNGGVVVAAAGAQAPGGVSLTGILPFGVNLAPQFGFTEGAAGAQTIITDYVFAANEILRF